MPPALRNTHFHFAPASGGKRHEHASCRSRTELAPPTAAIPARLSSAEARERLARFGPNDPTAVRRGALALELLTLFLNPLVVILLVASMVSDFLSARGQDHHFPRCSHGTYRSPKGHRTIGTAQDPPIVSSGLRSSAGPPLRASAPPDGARPWRHRRTIGAPA